VQGEDDDFEELDEPTASQAAAGTSTDTDASATPGAPEPEARKTK